MGLLPVPKHQKIAMALGSEFTVMLKISGKFTMLGEALSQRSIVI